MGLDTVEMVMEFEDEFGISIPDAEAEQLQTVGQTVDYIVKVLRGQMIGNDPEDWVCVSARRFYQVRRGLQESFGVARSRVRPRVAIAELIPPGEARGRWKSFTKEHGLPRPPFSLFTTGRFPRPKTTLGELIGRSRPGEYRNRQGEVDADRVWIRIREIVSDQMGVDLEEIQKHTHYMNDLNAG